MSVLNAQTINSGYVYGEDGGEENTKCKFDFKSGIAAVESALRYNRVKIENSPEAEGVDFYINVTNLEIDNNMCSASISLRVGYFKTMNIPQTNKSIMTTIVLCSKESLVHFFKVNMQSKVNSILKDSVDQCISKVEKKAR